ncbi:MAG: NAD(P)H-hydrate dehydratase [Candidatus Omnitrophica bacterium]|jgi:NAD(P)H-hydrate epimerase|nr:NAD(P)H-hydrate dehydratase [Candidatus Omnitrophota bacterium]
MQWPAQLLRKPDTYKGDYGHVLILGGSIGLTGAVCLAASAALKIGSGLVTVGVPKLTNTIFEIKLTEVMSFPLSDNRGYITPKALREVKQILPRINSIVLGPGASLKPCTRRFIFKVLEEVDKPIVIDADAISAIACNVNILKRRKARNLVLTPHLGEFSRLVKLDKSKINEERKELVKDFSLRYNLVLVLKGYRTLVGYNGEIFENNTGNPGMATAGAGDVLSGIISGLIAQRLDYFEASKLGVYLHGLSGDLAAKDKTENCLIASDIIEYLPQAIKFTQS